MAMLQMTADEHDLLAYMFRLADAAGWGVPTELEDEGWDIERYQTAYNSLEAALLS